MSSPVWLDKAALLLAHDEVVGLTGGAPGIRDLGLLESALARAENLHLYEGEEDRLVLAATYAVAIAKNHPFVDGNKRAAFIAMLVFLGRNGLRLTASQAGAIDAMLAVADGSMGVETLSAWLRDNTAVR